MNRPPLHEQVNEDAASPLVRRASLPAQQTQAYRESVGTNAGIHREDVPYTTVEQPPRHKRNAMRLDQRQQSPAPDVVEDEDEEEDYDPGTTRLPSSSRRYPGAQSTNQRTPVHHGLSPIPPRQSRPQEGQQALINNKPVVFFQGQWHPVTTHDTHRTLASPFQADRQTEEHVPLTEPAYPPQRHKKRLHWLTWVGICLFTMVLGFVLITVLSNWLQVKYDDLLYGRPRTFQIDVVVGHNDSPSNPSHFQCLNLNKQIQVIEFPGGNSSKAKVYQGPTLVGPGADLTVCTLSFRDVSGDGRPDMVLSIGGETFILINDGSSFRNVRQGEHITL